MYLVSRQRSHPVPAPVTELRTLPVGIPDPGGEVHDASGILAVGKAQCMSQLVDRLGQDTPPVHLRVRGIAVHLGPEPEGGDERPPGGSYSE